MKQKLNLSPLFIVLLIAINLISISCKDENNDPAEGSKPLLATMQSYSQDGKMHQSDTYHYDSKRRLIEVESNDKYKTIFEYSESRVIVKSYNKDSLEETQILQLDDKGLCLSTIWDENYTTDYTYDDKGYRKTSVEKEGNSTTVQTYTVFNENYVTISSQGEYAISATAKEMKPGLLEKAGLVKTFQREVPDRYILKSASDQISNSLTDFEFYTDKINTIDMENKGIYFFGKQNKNPIKQQSVTFTNMPGYTIQYSYEYDNKGRIIKQIWKEGGYDVFTYVE